MKHSAPQPRNIPARNRHFTGRRDLIAGLHATLRQAPAVTLCGPAGIGKTQIAVEYAHRHYARDALVWWVRASDPATLMLDYAQLGQKLGGADALHDLPRAVQATSEWLAAHTGWLVVFDEAEDPALLQDYLPQPDGGRVLCLTRSGAAAPGTVALAVGPLSRAESVSILRARCRTGQHQTDLTTIAAQLGDHPLAVTLAGAYLRSRAGSPASYLRLLAAERKRGTDGAPSAPELAFRAALQVFQQFDDKTPVMALLMHTFSFFRHEDLPLELFTTEFLQGVRQAAEEQGVKSEHDPVDILLHVAKEPRVLAKFLAGLWVVGLLYLDSDKLDPHERAIRTPRLIQELWRRHTRPDDQALWDRAAQRLLQHGLRGDLAHRLLPHALCAVRRPEALGGIGRVHSFLLLHHLAEWFMARRAHGAAEGLLKTALRLAQEQPLELKQGSELVRSRVLIRLAECQKERHDYDAARASAEQARALLQAAPQQSVDVARAENCLGGVLAAQKEYAGAERHLLRAAMLFRGQNGSEEGYAGSQVNLGQLLVLAGKREEAERAFCRALLSYESLGVTDGRRATAHYHLAQVLSDLGRKQAARSHFERCLALYELLPASEQARVDLWRQLQEQQADDQRGAEASIG